ncbi:MAG: ATP-dependent DNA helicase RecG [Candidatus Gracilibacteria bacterium]|nr:ATP-dependent DNA helicase RecG [Candidatus Gracilibacteria bacterium]
MLNTPLTKSLLHTTDNYIKALEKGGVCTVGDLLNQYPREYEDRTNVLDNFSLINIKDKNTILVTLVSINTQMTGGGKLISKAVLEDKNGFLSESVWFNRKYLATTLQAYTGKKVIVSGKVKYAFGKITFQSPEVETDLSKVSGEIVPVYSDINYIPSKWTSGKVELLKKYVSEIVEDLPESIIKKYNFISKKEAVYKVHFPKNKHDIELAKHRLAYGELYEINHRAISTKYESFKNTEGKSLAIKMNAETVKDIISNMPFDLTDHQKIVLFQILKDMEKPHSMQRLLEGDVGTGKTAVALIASIHGIIESSSSRIQVAIMAPTEILARQHFESMQELLMKYNISSHLLVGSLTKKQKEAVKSDLKTGNIDLVIGTHALVQEDVSFYNLGFVVVDEQHRFGVKQREVLERGFGNKSGLIPHSLNMTATPIPRTLALTLYGDQDLSIISQYPKGRKEIYTKVAKNDIQRSEIELFVRSQLEQGRQVFWISPLVEESEKIDLANAISTYESLIGIFHPFRVGLLHGKMKPKEKDEVMREFSENKIQILSSTSVVEVGVNIPNASIMCIEGAERFGLSQLHQFRGRVGRGAYQSYCYLFPTSGNQTDRLKAMESTNNGFELAEIDLELRGPGEVYGLRQSGVPDLKVADLRDLELISQIREDIEELFEKSEKSI